jgi:phytol kinase
MYLLLTVIAVFVILIANELLWRKKTVHGEFSRKFVHVSVGSYVAFWPFYLSWDQIRLVGLLFLIAVVISKTLNIFEAIHSVQRPTWGEACFALAVISVTFITQNKDIYAASLLQMSLADGLAAIIGIRYGGKYSYIILNHTKSIIGTLTFFIVSLLVLIGFKQFSATNIDISTLALISLGASLLENIAVLGLDNLLVPLFVALLITHH